MLRFFVVMVNLNPGLTVADVQTALTANVAWYRIANNVWVVHSIYNSAWLYQQLQPLVNPSGTLFISYLDVSERRGWMPQEFWNWLAGRLVQAGMTY